MGLLKRLREWLLAESPKEPEPITPFQFFADPTYERASAWFADRQTSEADPWGDLPNDRNRP